MSPSNKNPGCPTFLAMGRDVLELGGPWCFRFCCQHGDFSTCCCWMLLLGQRVAVCLGFFFSKLLLWRWMDCWLKNLSAGREVAWSFLFSRVRASFQPISNHRESFFCWTTPLQAFLWMWQLLERDVGCVLDVPISLHMGQVGIASSCSLLQYDVPFGVTPRAALLIQVCTSFLN